MDALFLLGALFIRKKVIALLVQFYSISNSAVTLRAGTRIVLVLNMNALHP